MTNKNEDPSVTSTTEVKQPSLTQLRASKKSLYIKNNTGFLWTLHENVGTGRIDLELRPAGQRDSITYLPPSALDAPGVVRNLALGKISISPDFEDELVELAQGHADHTKNVLDQFHVELQESANARAIDVRDKMQDVLSRSDRKRITPAGQQQNQSVINEFINPSPIHVEDGTVRDAMTGELIKPAEDDGTGIRSVTLTPSVKNVRER